MSGALPFLVSGLLLILLLVFSLLRANTEGDARFESFEDGKSDPRFRAELFPQDLAARLFGPEDQEYIAKQGCVRLKQVFRKQRTDLALCWLRRVRSNATKLMGIHNRAAGKNSGLQPLVELRILIEYCTIQMTCYILALVIRVRGPVDLGRMVRYPHDVSNRLYEAVKELLPGELATENGNGIHVESRRRGG